MKSLIYYFPCVQSVNPDNQSQIYADAGLSDVLRATVPDARGCSKGPDDGNGCTVTAMPEHRTSECRGPSYKPDEQTWQEGADGKYWVGYWNNAKPGPEDLARKEQIGGHKAELEDGHEWLVPVARDMYGGTRLPERINWGPDGEPVAQILPRYQGFSHRAGEMHDHCCQNDTYGGFAKDVLPLAVEALGLNYYAGKHELGLLGTITTTNAYKVIDAMLDIPSINKMMEEKKNGRPSRRRIHLDRWARGLAPGYYPTYGELMVL